MAQQTPIGWLIDQMFKQGYFDGNKPLTYTNLDHLQNQATEMFKQRIKEAFCEGENQQGFEGECELYYNETYKNKNDK